MKAAIFDTKSYDRTFFERENSDGGIDLSFHEFRLEVSTASTAEGCGAVCVFVNDRLDRPCLEALAHLGVGLVALRCAGFNNVDLGAAKELGLQVVRVPAYSPHAVAEHTVALLLTLNRQIHRAYNRVRDQNFSLRGLVGFDLHGKTAGIVGTGKIGRLVAQILRGFGMRVVAYDLYPDKDWAIEHGVVYVEMPTLFRESDVISLHTPLTPETHYLVDEASLALTKPNVFLVNTSRGGLVDTTAVIQALKARQLGGVALDVYEIEEGVFFEDLSGEVLHDDELARLLTFPNVLVTSHQGFLTAEALGEISRVTCENLRRFASGSAFLEGTAVEK